tara:strand:+ start:2822 stop:4996 length:2175 start_codon:yes stop_codon:yes gene_type:complete
MKLNKKYLFGLIMEALEDDGLSNEERQDFFAKAMDLASVDWPSVQQALELIQYVNFDEKQMQALKSTMEDTILGANGPDEPGPALKELGFDFHQIFQNEMGFRPPEGEFELKNKIFSLRANPGGNRMEFEFYFDQQGPLAIEPFFHFKSPLQPYDGYVGMDMDREITFSAGSARTFGADEITISKRELPGRLRKAMGFGPDEDIPGWPGLPKGSAPTINENQGNLGFSTAEEFEEWLYSEYMKGAKYFKQGAGNFNHGEFKKVIKTFLNIEWRPANKRPWKEHSIHEPFAAYRFIEEADHMFPFIWRLLGHDRSHKRPDGKSYGWQGSNWEDRYYRLRHSSEHPIIKRLQDLAKKMMNALSFSSRQLPTFKKALGLKESGKQKLNKDYLFHMINEVLREDEEEQEPIDILKDKIENVIKLKDWSYYVQFFELIDTFEDSALIEKEEANALRERLWGAVWFLKVYDRDNLDEVAELFLTHKNLPEDTKEDIHSSIYYYGGYFRDTEWTLKYVAKSLGLNLKIEAIDPDNLYELSGADGDDLDKLKDHLLELGEEEKYFEVYPETGGLLFGVLAKPYVNFEKKIEEIFGATPSGDPMMSGGSMMTVSIRKSIDEPFEAPMVKGSKVTADIMFEWSPETEYGMEITLLPAKLGTTPQTLLDEYYGIWVSVAQEGPNIGKLEIGIQNYEDEFADHKQVQNKNGTYGFTVEEMKDKIKEITGIDLNEIN